MIKIGSLSSKAIIRGVMSLLVVLCCGISFCQGKTGTDLDVRLSKEDIFIGDDVRLEVFFPGGKKMDVEFPEKIGMPEGMELVRAYPEKEGPLWGKVPGYVYVLRSFAAGKYHIPSVKVRYRAKGADKWNETSSAGLDIDVQTTLLPDSKDIRDIKGLIVFRNYFLLVSVLLVVSVLAALALRAAIRRFRVVLREASLDNIMPPHERAYKRLEELKAKELPSKGFVDEYYTELSDIIRRYLEARFSYKAPEMTTEEFLSFLKNTDDLFPEHKRLLKEFLSHCDMVKFAKFAPRPIDIIDSFKSAMDLVDQTKKGEEEERGTA
ncbi:MAG: hypothetical protein PHH49_00955 [Candidatus Omnitrophica bacterium]|nr:hypothetical protein [Candidatus Omnitrophota bacterium]MDD5487521.1 hypothetical protein [Candidatus Omnitrophota bacterium]